MPSSSFLSPAEITPGMSSARATSSGPLSQCSAPRLISFHGALVAWKVSWLERDSSRASGVAIPEALKKRSEEHTSELQSLMRTSYARFCLKKEKMEVIGHIRASYAPAVDRE